MSGVCFFSEKVLELVGGGPVIINQCNALLLPGDGVSAVNPAIGVHHLLNRECSTWVSCKWSESSSTCSARPATMRQ